MAFYQYIGDMDQIAFYGNIMNKGVPVELEGLPHPNPKLSISKEQVEAKADGNSHLKRVNLSPEKAKEIREAHEMLRKAQEEIGVPQEDEQKEEPEVETETPKPVKAKPRTTPKAK